jgi:hypothetical protein
LSTQEAVLAETPMSWRDLVARGFCKHCEILAKNLSGMAERVKMILRRMPESGVLHLAADQ